MKWVHGIDLVKEPLWLCGWFAIGFNGGGSWKGGIMNRQKYTNLMNYERRVVEGVWPNLTTPTFTCVKMGTIFFVSLWKWTVNSSNIIALWFHARLKNLKFEKKNATILPYMYINKAIINTNVRYRLWPNYPINHTNKYIVYMMANSCDSHNLVA